MSTTQPPENHEPTPLLGLGSSDVLGPAPRWWHCDTHGAGNHTAWGCPECVREMRGEITRLVRERDDQRAKLLPLLALAQEVFSIAAHGCLLDGDEVNVPTRLWAEEWDRRISGPNDSVEPVTPARRSSYMHETGMPGALGSNAGLGLAPERMKFADVCALMPEGVNWGEHLTPQIARELVQAGADAERERCANLCEDIRQQYNDSSSGEDAARACAIAIRGPNVGAKLETTAAPK